MASKRKFDKLSEGEKIRELFTLLNYALRETDISKRKTDVYGIAKQYGGSRIRKSDFDIIKKMTVEEIVSKIFSE